MNDHQDPEITGQPNEISESEIEEWFESEDTPPETTPGHIDIVQRYAQAQLRIVRTDP